jgi:hypothetical protein
MNAASQHDGYGDSQAEWAPLIDVTHERVGDLLARTGDDTALARSIQRLVYGLDDPNGVISAFSSFVE